MSADALNIPVIKYVMQTSDTSEFEMVPKYIAYIVWTADVNDWLITIMILHLYPPDKGGRTKSGEIFWISVIVNAYFAW